MNQLKFLINCKNDKCKHYFEDGCFNKKETIRFSKNGRCESFKEGKHEGYSDIVIKLRKSDNKDKSCARCKGYFNCDLLQNNKEYENLPNGVFDMERGKFRRSHICDNFKNMCMEFPIEVSDIKTTLKKFDMDKKSIGKFVAIRPCAAEYLDKTYLGLFLGSLPIGINSMHNPKTEVLENSFSTNSAIFVFELNKIIYGCESWWGVIEREEQLKDINDYDIENVWYVKALKQLSEEEKTI